MRKLSPDRVELAIDTYCSPSSNSSKRAIYVVERYLRQEQEDLYRLANTRRQLSERNIGQIAF